MGKLQSQFLSRVPGIAHGFLAPGVEPPAGFARLRQVHSAVVIEGKGQPTETIEADGLFTRGPRAVAIQTADCLPVLLASGDGAVVAAIHAGWRGLHKGILPRAVEAMGNAGALVAAIGPAIGPCCFEVSRDVIDAFEKDWGALWKNGPRPWATERPPTAHPENPHAPVSANNLWLDLERIATLQLANAGLAPSRIERVGGCTYCGPGGLASYRRATHEGLKAGRQWSWIGKSS
jgi:YfiH family protein